MEQIVEIPFRTLNVLAFPNTNGTQAILETDLVLANLGARAIAVGSTFEFFRFKKLGGYAYTDGLAPDGVNGLLSGSQYLAFVESNAQLTGTATTINQLAQYQYFKGGGPFDKLKFQVAKGVLAGNNYKWFNTASTGAPSDSLSPGLFVQAVQTNLSGGTTSVTQWLVIEGILEFRGMITPALQFGSAQHDPMDSVQFEPDEPLYANVKVLPNLPLPSKSESSRRK